MPERPGLSKSRFLHQRRRGRGIPPRNPREIRFRASDLAMVQDVDDLKEVDASYLDRGNRYYVQAMEALP